MAEKRMFTNKIVSSDPFKEMPLSTQALYFHLGMNADDEGFLNNAKSIQRSILASDDDLKLLIAKRFVIPFESGVVVIKHWKMNNQIQPSKLRPTQYTEEKKLLGIKENKAYTLFPTECQQLADEMPTKCRRNADEFPTDCRRNADEFPTDCRRNADEMSPSIEEYSKEEYSTDILLNELKEEYRDISKNFHPDEKMGITPTQESELCQKYGFYALDIIERAKKYKGCNNIDTITKWCEEEKEKRKNSNRPQEVLATEEQFQNLINNTKANNA